MSLQPQSPLFAASLNHVLRRVALLESQRRWSSYVAASMLAVPVGLLPWILQDSIFSTFSNSLQGRFISFPPLSAADGIYILPFLPIALCVIVILTLHADLVYAAQLKRTRLALADGDCALLSLDENRARELHSRLRMLVLPDLLGVPTGDDLAGKIEFLAHYHRCFQGDQAATGNQAPRMAVRQGMWINLAICFCTGLLCFILAGFLLLPFAIWRVFRGWPATSAVRMAFSEYLHELGDRDKWESCSI